MRSTPEPGEQLLTIGQAATLAQVHPDTIRRWEQRGYITALRTPSNHRRYRLSDIQALTAQDQDQV